MKTITHVGADEKWVLRPRRRVDGGSGAAAGLFGSPDPALPPRSARADDSPPAVLETSC